MAVEESRKQNVQADSEDLLSAIFTCGCDTPRQQLEKDQVKPPTMTPRGKSSGIPMRQLNPEKFQGKDAETLVRELIPEDDQTAEAWLESRMNSQIAKRKALGIDVEISATTKAAYHVHDAMEGFVHLRPLPTKEAQASHGWQLATEPWALLAATLYPFLTAFERPIWCIRKGDPTLCDSELYPSYPISYLDNTSSSKGMSKFINWGLEASCLLPIILNTVFVAKTFGMERRFNDSPMFRVKCYTLMLLFADIVYAYATPPQWRAAPYLRIVLFLTFSYKTCNQFIVMRRMAPSMVMIVVTLFIYMMIYAWVGVLLFPKIDTSEEGTVWFNGIGGGLWSLIVLITTANFPDVMMPAYTQNRCYVLFFIAFLVGGFFFLMNVVLAVVVNSFEEERQAMFEGQDKVRKNGLAEAFKILDNDNLEAPGYLTYEQMKEVFVELNRYKDIPEVDMDMHDIFLRCLDTGHSNSITKEEFSKLFDVLSLSFKKIRRTPWFKRTFPEMADTCFYQNLEKFVSPGEETVGKDAHKRPRDAPIDRIVDVLLFLNFVSSVAGTWGSIRGDALNMRKVDQLEKTVWAPVDLAFTLAFSLEAVLKILILGDRYWIELCNQFDAAVTVVTLGVSLIVYMPNTFNDPIWIRSILVFRVLRLLRLVGTLPQFQLLMKSLAHMYNDGRIAGIFMALISVMYFFACLGMDLFGGMINTDPKSPYYKAVKASDFGDAGYYANNFNDIFSGMVTLFELLVVNNWFEISDGFAAALDSSWPRVFFLAFYVIGVMLSLNVVVALIIDNWTKSWEELTLNRSKTLIETGDGTTVVAWGSGLIKSANASAFIASAEGTDQVTSDEGANAS